MLTEATKLSSIGRGGDPLEAARRATDHLNPYVGRPTADVARIAAEAEIAKALADAPMSAADRRYQRHRRLLNSILMTLRDEGREYFVNEDVPRVYGMIAALDEIAGFAPAELDESLRAGLPVSEKGKGVERATHAHPTAEQMASPSFNED